MIKNIKHICNEHFEDWCNASFLDNYIKHYGKKLKSTEYTDKILKNSHDKEDFKQELCLFLMSEIDRRTNDPNLTDIKCPQKYTIRVVQYRIPDLILEIKRRSILNKKKILSLDIFMKDYESTFKIEYDFNLKFIETTEITNPQINKILKDNLTDIQIKIVILKYKGGRSLKDIAVMLNISLRTVKRRYKEAELILHRELLHKEEDNCKHLTIHYKYQITSNKQKAWIKFCEICGERISKQFCIKPGRYEQLRATEYIKNENDLFFAEKEE